MRALIGSLQYASVHTRPDLSSRLSILQSAINRATIETLITANQALHEAKKHHDVTIKIQPIATADLRFLAFSDASFASKSNPNSHTGSIVMATHKDIGNNTKCPVNPISWGCKKIQRVVTSTLAAETTSLNTVLDQLSWIRLCWAWILDPKVPWKNPKLAFQNLPETYSTATMKAQELPESFAATDCKSLYDLVTRTAVPSCTEFRTQLTARSIKDLLSEGVALRWVHSGAQLADALTKIMENTFLRETLRLGHYKLHDELEVLKNRASSRNRLRWLKGESTNQHGSGCNDVCFLEDFSFFGSVILHHCGVMEETTHKGCLPKNPGFTQHLFSKAHVAPEGPGLKVGGKSSVLSHKLGSEAASLFFGQGPFLAGWITHFTGGPRTIAVAGKRLPVSIRAAQDLCAVKGKRPRVTFAFGGGSGDCSCQCEVPTTHNIYVYVYVYVYV